jgi:hypothetical protein
MLDVKVMNLIIKWIAPLFFYVLWKILNQAVIPSKRLQAGAGLRPEFGNEESSQKVLLYSLYLCSKTYEHAANIQLSDDSRQHLLRPLLNEPLQSGHALFTIALVLGPEQLGPLSCIFCGH